MTPWQKAPPREPGVYWTRDSRGGLTIVEVIGDGSHLYVIIGGEDNGYGLNDFHEWGPRVLPPGEDAVARIEALEEVARAAEAAVRCSKDETASHEEWMRASLALDAALARLRSVERG